MCIFERSYFDSSLWQTVFLGIAKGSEQLPSCDLPAVTSGCSAVVRRRAILQLGILQPVHCD